MYEIKLTENELDLIISKLYTAIKNAEDYPSMQVKPSKELIGIYEKLQGIFKNGTTRTS